MTEPIRDKTGLNGKTAPLAERIARRREAFIDIPMRTVPDLCELSLV